VDYNHYNGDVSFSYDVAAGDRNGKLQDRGIIDSVLNVCKTYQGCSRLVLKIKDEPLSVWFLVARKKQEIRRWFGACI